MKNPSFDKRFFRLGFVCIMVIPVLASTQETPPHWSYSGQEGPDGISLPLSTSAFSRRTR
jgi:hypothetical protein